MESIQTNSIDQAMTISSTDINNLTISENNINGKIFTKNEKKQLASRIEQIKSKKIYLKIFKIVSDDNNHYVTNPNGIFFNLNNLSNITLQKINKFLDLVDEYKLENKKNAKWDDLLHNGCTDINDTYENNDNKLNNHEKMVLKKQQLINDDDVVLWGSNDFVSIT